MDNFLKEAINIYIHYFYAGFEISNLISNVNWNELIRDQNFEEYKKKKSKKGNCSFTRNLLKILNIKS